MGRYKLTLEYDGRGFVGWQRQDNGPSIQQALEEAITAFSGETAATVGAGRTDSGVHALGQVAHVDLARDWPAHEVMGALNHHLKPNPITVLSVEAVGDDFNARFSARERAYRYRIVNRRSPLTFDKGRAWLVAEPLDAGAMHEAAQTHRQHRRVSEPPQSLGTSGEALAAYLVGTAEAPSLRLASMEAVLPCPGLIAGEWVSRDGGEGRGHARRHAR